jgi:hypothetical protein
MKKTFIYNHDSLPFPSCLPHSIFAPQPVFTYLFLLGIIYYLFGLRTHIHELFRHSSSFYFLRMKFAYFQQFNSPRTLHNEPIYEGDETWPDSGNGYGNMQTSTSLQFNHLLEGNKENGVQASNGVANQGWQDSPMKYGQPLHMDMSSGYA